MIDISTRFWSKVTPAGECLVWTGSLNNQGYGQFYVRRGLHQLAHRVSYELNVGPIPEGLTIDHLCRNPACVAPSHLEPVTQKTNNLRGRGFAAINAKKTHCPKGHPYDEENTYVTPRGDRQCWTCHYAAKRALSLKNRVPFERRSENSRRTANERWRKVREAKALQSGETQ